VKPSKTATASGGWSDMKTIQLSKGFVAFVDDADYDRVSAHKWSATKTKINAYGIRKIRREDGSTTSQLLHRFIIGVTDAKLDVDHEDHTRVELPAV
jgi:hypothetical protein